jgi:hypothetical protein
MPANDIRSVNDPATNHDQHWQRSQECLDARPGLDPTWPGKPVLWPSPFPLALNVSIVIERIIASIGSGGQIIRRAFRNQA